MTLLFLRRRFAVPCKPYPIVTAALNAYKTNNIDPSSKEDVIAQYSDYHDVNVSSCNIIWDELLGFTSLKEFDEDKNEGHNLNWISDRSETDTYNHSFIHIYNKLI